MEHDKQKRPNPNLDIIRKKNTVAHQTLEPGTRGRYNSSSVFEIVY
jgi:hypothetical protein